MLIVVTGAFGFIGSNIIRELNRRGFNDIIAVDNLSNSKKIINLADCNILEFITKEDFIATILQDGFNEDFDYIFHQGACSDTTEVDGKYMMANNYHYSLTLLEYAQDREIPLLYASSAAVYGAKEVFVESREHELPLNVYGYSKFLFDEMVRRYLVAGVSAPLVGLRYFNVYGKYETHKERMASVVLHNFRQLVKLGRVQLFMGCNGYNNGCQMRDFICIEDVIKVNMFFFDSHCQSANEISGIFNCGSGVARSFNDLALATINSYLSHHNKPPVNLDAALSDNLIEYIEFPHDLAKRYQCYTKADISALRSSGYRETFSSLEDGVVNYVNWLYQSL